MNPSYELDRLRADNVQLTRALKQLVESLERHNKWVPELTTAKHTPEKTAAPLRGKP